MDFPIKTRVAGGTIGNRQHYIRNYCRLAQKFFLEREPDNPHDPNAIKVLVSKYKALIGYIPKKIASQLAPLMNSGIELRCGFVLKIFDENDLSKPYNLIIKIWKAKG